MIVFKDNFKKPDSAKDRAIVGSSISAPKKSTRSKIPANSIKTIYSVELGDQLNELASAFYCTETDIMVWNRLTSRKLRKGQELVIYISREKRPVIEPIADIARIEENAKSKSSRYLKLHPVPLATKDKKYKSSKKKWRKRDKSYLYHKIKRGESLNDVADQYSVSIKTLLKINDIKVHQALETRQEN